MTMYQDCHIHYGYQERETALAQKLLEKHGKPTPQTVKELRHKTDMPMSDCARMLRCMWRDMELERLQSENAKLQASNEVISEDHAALCEQNAKLWELVTALEDCRNTTCNDCIRWDYPNGGCSLDDVLRELGIKLNSSNRTNNERTSDELLPCPFCGSTDLYVNVGIHNGLQHESVTIGCNDCIASIWGATEERARAAWNRRKNA